MGFALLHGAQAAFATFRAPPALLSWQVPKLNNATSLLSIIKQQDAHTYRPQLSFISPHNDKNILSLIVASRLSFWISEHLRLTTWHVVLISVCPAFLFNFLSNERHTKAFSAVFVLPNWHVSDQQYRCKLSTTTIRPTWAEIARDYSNLPRTERCWDRIPVGPKFSSPIQNGSGT
jgi:hypothetical protein